MISVKGKWALITGSSRGIGKLSAVFMAKQGCNLILHSRKMEHNDETAALCRAEGVKVYQVEAELSDLDQVNRMLRQIDDLGRQIDIVLNNAGLQIAYRTDYLTTPAEDYTESFKINTTAPMMICYHFLPGMIERGFGRILNTTSGIALDPQQAGYSASKAALNKVTIDIGSKVNGTDVMINLTDPGWCRTDLGGPHAPNAPESAIPGIVAGVFANDKKSGRIFGAQSFNGMKLEAAVEKIEKEYDAPY
ncbi:MAG: short-chain dehydrogenase [Clostridiales bacterium]|nr:short-chain dehydrogenase [Clostridiales bacterium]